VLNLHKALKPVLTNSGPAKILFIDI
jgi:hypothetical protein